MKTITLTLFLLLSFQCFSQDNMELKSVLPFSDFMNDIWGYQDTSGKEYALCGLQSGVAVVDVSIPNNPLQLHFIPGETSVWRDIKTWDKYAYVTNESGKGIQIIDLRFLPDSIAFKNWEGGLLKLRTAHNLYIDTSGTAFVFGSNIFGAGVVILDLSNSPKNPVYLGAYSDHYVHDGFAQKDTVYTSEIFIGEFAVVDVSNKSNPIVIARQQTPSRFTHNCWPSPNGRFLFTTDELPGAPVTAYDISDLSNIQKLDEYRSNPGDSVIPHNVHVLNDFLVVSYYTDGVKIIDASNRDNLIEVGNYDTSPFSSGPGFDGCWGVYPYLPSGLILASDIEEGLYVLDPNYIKACYLRGVVSDTVSGINVPGVKVEIIGSSNTELTSITGNYAIGIADSGLYDIRFSKKGCTTSIRQNVMLNNGQTTILDLSLDCDVNTSIPELKNELIKVYPTLFSDHFRIEMEDHGYNSVSELQIHNSQGQIVMRRKINRQSTTISGLKNLPNGIYIVQVENEGRKHFFKALKH
ncbi:MAG: choice-of-anchor B family protein [Chitinophagales bacterium]|nr:choice-of-anchor B family protein [Chitinophagales bacterium]